jgi:ribosomal protein S21
MPIIITAANGKSDSTSDLIRRFKRAIAATNLVITVKDRRFHVKPAEAKNRMMNEKRRLKKKLRSLKRMKNISPEVIKRLTERLSQ